MSNLCKENTCPFKGVVGRLLIGKYGKGLCTKLMEYTNILGDPPALVRNWIALTCHAIDYFITKEDAFPGVAMDAVLALLNEVDDAVKGTVHMEVRACEERKMRAGARSERREEAKR